MLWFILYIPDRYSITPFIVVCSVVVCVETLYCTVLYLIQDIEVTIMNLGSLVVRDCRVEILRHKPSQLENLSISGNHPCNEHRL